MALKGGYKIVDLDDKPITTGSQNGVFVAGIYNAIKYSARNAILLAGLTIDNAEKSDVWAYFRPSGTDYVANVPYVGIVTVKNDNTVFVAASNDFNLPAVPSANGTYYLKAVKSSSGVTYSWATIS